MDNPRPSSDVEHRALKSAVRRALRLAGNAVSFAECTRVSKSAIGRYGSTGADDAEFHMPIDVALDLDREAGLPVVTGALAQSLGFRLVVDHIEPGGRVSPNDTVTVMSSACEFGSALSRALEDGRIDESEVREVNQTIERLRGVLNSVQKRLPVRGS